MTVNITAEDIHRIYPAARRIPKVRAAVIRDVAFDVLLRLLATAGLYALCGLVFKGGTALRKCRFGHKGRFSDDLDFDTAEEPAVVVELMRDILQELPVADMAMSITERRGHFSLQVSWPPLDETPVMAKLDFSPRGLVLPPRAMQVIRTPVHGLLQLPGALYVPVMDLRENLAGKLTRWKSTPVIRDLYDLAALLPPRDDHELIASLYVLKAYIEWAPAPPNRRDPTPAATLSGPLTHLDPRAFRRDDLLLPANPREEEITALTSQYLQRLRRPFADLDAHITGPALNRFATAGNNNLLHAALIAMQRISDAHAPTADPTIPWPRQQSGIPL